MQFSIHAIHVCIYKFLIVYHVLKLAIPTFLKLKVCEDQFQYVHVAIFNRPCDVIPLLGHLKLTCSPTLTM
jgi:hypothetical protein